VPASSADAYILDPAEDPPDAPRTKDFPGETFRGLKEREIKEQGEYRTRRLVLAAWDRLQEAPTTSVAEAGADVSARGAWPVGTSTQPS
jgi:hypothetical protein